MTKKNNQEIEDRIRNEIIVDAYDELERALGWYYYLRDNMIVPFKAKCIQSIKTSPLKIGEIVEVIALDDEESCKHDILVQVKWRDSTLSVPLKQLKGINLDEDTKQALTDWSYWISQGYCF